MPIQIIGKKKQMFNDKAISRADLYHTFLAFQTAVPNRHTYTQREQVSTLKALYEPNEQKQLLGYLPLDIALPAFAFLFHSRQFG